MNEIDKHVDDILIKCLNITKPKSFFLFAGAGSGKTRSLITALKRVWEIHGKSMQLRNQQIAVITYTNAASEEIIERLRKELIDVSLFEVSTIHSFAWKVIQDYTIDIKCWLKIDITQRIVKWEDEETRGRKGTDASRKRLSSIVKGKEKIESLDNILRFKYNPNGENSDKSSLQHEDVISICASFLREKSLFRKIIIQKYPIILIDESQDTKKDLIEALFELERINPTFSLGLFGDMMQRIYLDGKEDLAKIIPSTWEQPMKKMNHRSEKRIVDLINKIRHDIDGIEQNSRLEKNKGIVRLFIFPTDKSNKESLEYKVKVKMGQITHDNLWLEKKTESVKTLILEHHMAAIRLGFSDLFKSLNRVEKYRTSLKDGSLSSLNFFTKNILPLIKAYRQGDKLQITRIITSKSSLLHAKSLIECEGSQIEVLKTVNNKVNSLFKLWDKRTPILKEVLLNIYDSNLFDIPAPLTLLASEITLTSSEKEEEEMNPIEGDITIEAWRDALECSFDEVENYYTYISDESQFATHQGVKGLEFDRVVAILSDEEAEGFLFSYEKLFGVKELTATDKKNIKDNKDSSMDRTKRLFYVVCSRAKESLALITYTEDIEKLKEMTIKNGWFVKDEILLEEDLAKMN